MVKQVEYGLGGNGVYTESSNSDRSQATVSRRKFIIGGAAATALVVAFGAGRLTRGSDEKAPSDAPVSPNESAASGMVGEAEESIEPTTTSTDIDKSVSSAEAEDNIGRLTQAPDLYAENRSDVDPHQLVGLSPEELADIAYMRIAPETESNAGFASAFGKKIELFMNSGLTLEDVKNARTEGYAVGERDAYGNNLGHYGDYVHQSYGEPMSKSLFRESIHGIDLRDIIAQLENQHALFANEFEAGLSETEFEDGTVIPPSANATVHITVGSVEELYTLASDRSLSISMTADYVVDGSARTRRTWVIKVLIDNGRDGKYYIALEPESSI